MTIVAMIQSEKAKTESQAMVSIPVRVGLKISWLPAKLACVS
jgi:hypothetical protein